MHTMHVFFKQLKKQFKQSNILKTKREHLEKQFTNCKLKNQILL